MIQDKCMDRLISHCRATVEGSLMDERLPEIYGQWNGDKCEGIKFRAGKCTVDLRCPIAVEGLLGIS
ncbi:hypothetical protein E3N88_37031 [Mikania micrantha]|uniref:Uncharacterized protein n=1 Tax=Mikania micrantha TaxID=192012 RepID=A0A5N6M602_9ASTR|nr:hypothetical protein E3N88_37031 [Mikania micrantha]